MFSQHYTNNVSYEPDTINDGYDWAMIPKGEFKVRVRARSSIQMKFAHGLEYPITNVSLDLAKMAGKTIEKTIWSNDEYRRKAISSFQQAKRFYEAARERAK